MMIEYSSTKEFERDLKHLLKRFPTLNEDLASAKRNAIELFHIHKIDNRSIEQVPKYSNGTVQIFKLRKFACKALKGRGCNSGIRIIYAFLPDNSRIEFIEMYFKGDKHDMNYAMARSYLDSLPSLHR